MDTATAFEQYHGLIISCVDRFCKSRPYANRDDCLSEAYLSFVDNHDRYKEGASSYTTFLSWHVSRRLMEAERQEYKRLEKRSRYDRRVRPNLEIAMEVDERDDAAEQEAMKVLLSRLGEEARFVVELILFETVHLIALVANAKTYTQYKRGLRTYLEDYLDWKRGRVTRVFKEIKTVMHELEEEHGY